jgi:hypothetical protein
LQVAQFEEGWKEAQNRTTAMSIEGWKGIVGLPHGKMVSVFWNGSEGMSRRNEQIHEFWVYIR